MSGKQASAKDNRLNSQFANAASGEGWRVEGAAKGTPGSCRKVCVHSAGVRLGQGG